MGSSTVIVMSDDRALQDGSTFFLISCRHTRNRSVADLTQAVLSDMNRALNMYQPAYSRYLLIMTDFALMKLNA